MADKHFSKTRLIVDLIGPVIDISSIPLFRDLDCRFDTEKQIADKLNSRAPILHHKEELNQKKYTEKEIFEVVIASLSRPSGIHLVEGATLNALYTALGAGFSVSLVSTVPDENVFSSAKKAVESYLSAYPLDYPMREKLKIEHINTQIKVDNNKSWIEKNECWRKYLGKEKEDHFTIIINDSSSEDLDITSDEGLFDEWIPGIIHQDDLSKRVKTIVDERKRWIEALKELRGRKEINFEKMRAVGDFYVWNEDIRNKITKKWEDATVLRKALDDSKPVCVFLGGPPGSGKSYFVKQCLKGLGAQYSEFPTMSLSGVAPREYVNAIERHIEDVYRKDKKSTVAFLDEVDTAVEGNTSFRYLMDPMTGSPTDARGLRISDVGFGEGQGLYWFFAGSAAGTRDSFVAAFYEKDKKVQDFFDRIQVYIELPGVSTPGEAMLQALVNLGQSKSGKSIIAIEKAVLLAFGSTNWESARQLQTACQLIAIRVEPEAQKIMLSDLKKDVPDITDFAEVVNNIEDAFEGELLSIFPNSAST